MLYPASCKASTDLQDSLVAGGFQVQRMDTYDTVRQAKCTYSDKESLAAFCERHLVLALHWIITHSYLACLCFNASSLQRGVKSAPQELLSQALQAQIVTFGSPSAVKAWVALAGMAVAAEKVSGVLSDLCLCARIRRHRSNTHALHHMRSDQAHKQACEFTSAGERVHRGNIC